jgi:NADP-dependent aldehyde dehydrogenase
MTSSSTRLATDSGGAVSFDVRTGEAQGLVSDSDPAAVTRALEGAAAAARAMASADTRARQGWLQALAAAVEGHADELVALADRESGLGAPRLTGEVARMAMQIRFYAEVALEGSWLGATIDRQVGSLTGLRRVNQPLGPIAVFGASNFPFAFGLLGNDTASALAAGCPVVAKAHPAHPALCERLGEIAVESLREAGAPEGCFATVAGFAAGEAIVKAPQITAVAFTGSQSGGMALWRLANEREVVIPVYAEMGTINPVVLTRAGLGRMQEVARGFVESFTLGTGQFCTKPGLLLAPRGAGVAEAVAAVVQEMAPSGWMLTEGIRDHYVGGLADLEAAGATLQVRITDQAAEGDESANPRGWSAGAALLSVEAADLLPGSRLAAEVFGPVSLVAEYDDLEDLTETISRLQGALAAAVMTDAEGGAGDTDLVAVVEALSHHVGRVAVNTWPTGVATSWAQHHGGPWPATSNPSSTSVGAAALVRFSRPVAYQDVPERALPAALKDANPWNLPRRLDGVLSTPTEPKRL